MGLGEIIDRIVALPPHEPGVAAVPRVELVAMVARMGRCLRRWRNETLADFARVSLSTVERVERAEPVGADSLDRIALALATGRALWRTGTSTGDHAEAPYRPHRRASAAS